eukprot:CAMPEP_0197641928 /NCGR_PEP_ID=MMETSP1338-20131121/15735_1 /TAXON_ID=43686 ORGANISM="Pelagodinium beii, Strain RCC1491" /NCGR_SAMPLE_ID=MMETSP1338 /ASSEMBLY_ACC=CAM_ASM_000754 /LENGTH=386 /DNA_ID=CAMNT_0043214979 /DNA_START=69 /DNA_END=1229 /DNA_ORIENTATION=+
MNGKETIYWQGVDISLVQLKNNDPVPPPPRRTPQWGAVGKFFLSADSDAGYNKAKQAWMNSQKQQGFGNQSRPRTAGASSPSKRGARKDPRPGAFALNREKDARLSRPSSAPTLLRNENLIAKKPHEDAVCQKAEDMAVDWSIGWMKREGRWMKEDIDAVDVLADPVLFDLKVLHNASQRAHTEKLAKKKAEEEKRKRQQIRIGRSHASSNKVRTAADSMKELNGLLDQDTKKHCARMKVPHMAITDSNLEQMVNKLHKIHQLQMALKTKTNGLDLEDESMAGLISDMKSLFSAVAIVPGDWKHPLVKLASFLNGGHEGRLHTMLQALDVACTGTISQKDFIDGLGFLAYPDTDYKKLFAMLDTDGVGELDINVLEEKLARLLGPE